MAASAEEWSGQLALKLIPVQPVKGCGGMQRRLYWKPHGWSGSCLKAGQAGTGCMGEERLTARTHIRTNTHMWILTHTNMQAHNSTRKPSSHCNLVCVRVCVCVSVCQGVCVLVGSAKCRVLIACVWTIPLNSHFSKPNSSSAPAD